MLKENNRAELIDVGLLFGNKPTLSEEDRYLSNQENDELNDLIDQMNIVRTAIRKKHPQGKEFVEGSMDCPICKTNKRWYMISDHYNGHIHSYCDNVNCVRFCE